ncbi:ABC transporter permease [Nakamurella leprariae]|nr:ABC transporter permease [Nakamurella leprariae]
MGRYVLGRLGQAVLVLWAAWTVSFVILYALPGDAVEVRLGAAASDITPEQIAALQADYGLDQPWFTQYLTQLGHALTGDLGRSFENGQSVTSLLLENLPATAALAGLALILAVVFGGGLAVLANGVRFRWLSRALLNLPALGVAVPGFWVGLMLLQLFSFRIELFPAIGNDGFSSLVLPAITLAIPTSAVIAQILAKSLHSSLGEPWSDTARAKGAGSVRVLFRHALRNAALPTLTITGLLVGQLLSGAVVAETVFSRTGLGRLTATSVSAQDTPVVQGLVLFGALVFVLTNLAVDLLYPLLDRRTLQRSTRRVARPAPVEVS